MSSYLLSVIGPICLVGLIAQCSLSLLAMFRLMADRPVPYWLMKSSASWILVCTAPLFFMMTGAWLKDLIVGTDYSNPGKGLVLLGALLPCGVMLCGALIIPLFVFAEDTAWALLAPGAKNLKILRECDQARAAEIREDFALAEERFKAELTGKPENDDVVYLSLGNLYQRQHRTREMVEAWRRALEGDLMPEAYLATALRISDALARELGSPAEAGAVLRQAIRRFPKDAEAFDFEKRLRDLSG
ncbi:MAG: hypothetical protein V1918_01750 [Planctomycetota bacterium]